MFGGDGRLRGAAPGLFGSAVGDHTSPGIAGLALREIPGRDRTTPAGRFIGGYGPSIDAGRVLWVDYESAVSIHPTATGVPAEKRVERLASATPDDNRITHGCINAVSYTPLDVYKRQAICRRVSRSTASWGLPWKTATMSGAGRCWCWTIAA